MTKEAKLSANNPQSLRDREKAKPIQRYPRIDPPLQLGQPIYHSGHGFCEVDAIEGKIVTISAGRKKFVVERNAFVTLVQAQVNWHLDWLNGEEWRLREGERLFIVKGLSRFGEWQAFLDRYEIPRSTADDLIRRYLNKLARKDRVLELPGNRASSEDGTDRRVTERINDSEDEERKELVAKEAEKRLGREPSHHSGLWSVRIKLPPDVITQCREQYKRGGNSAKKYWQNAAYKFVELDFDDSSSEEESSASPED